jgi:hypothetical protein
MVGGFLDGRKILHDGEANPAVQKERLTQIKADQNG